MAKTRARGQNEDAAATRREDLTEKRIQALEIPEKATSVYDRKVAALGLRLSPKGKRTFFWFRSVDGRPKWVTIGEWPDVKLDGPNGARAKAEELNVTLANWKKDGKKTPNPFEQPDGGALTLEGLVEKYIDEHVLLTTKNKEKTAKGIRDAFTWYLSDWKRKELGEIRRPDVLSRYAKLWKTIGGSTANHTVALLRAIYRWAIEREIWVGKNPAVLLKDDKQYKDNERKRFLKPEEAKRLCDVCDEYEKGTNDHRDLAHFVLLSLACGQRKKTTMHARWEKIDLGKKTWELEASETKNGKAFVVRLTPGALTILKKREDTKRRSPYVFPGIDPRKPRFDFNTGAWKSFLKKAGLDYPREDERNFRIHDLRHSYVSYQIMAGRSLEQAAHAVGHASVRSTARYAHLMRQDALESAVAGELEMQKRMAQAQKQLTAGD